MMIMLATIAIIFLAAMVKTTLGFGESLLAMPLLVMTVGLGAATPIVGFMGLALTLLMVGAHWRQIDLRATWKLLAAALLGLPFGILLVRAVPGVVGLRLLGLVLIGFGLFSLLRPQIAVGLHPLWGYGFGFLAGVLGSAYNTSGPPLVLYSALRGWPPVQFRATMQSFFLPISVLIVGAQVASGLWTPWVLATALLALPALLLAVPVGERLQRRIPVERFSRVVHGALVVLGLMLLR
ncbi:sulfite exporter TauE/SafE family protein [Chloroflexia bacterium SDU3-3]|nr:sulfite exporter TauE/SafE family protein [Chloroflexia bacterium SDU3-3]